MVIYGFVLNEKGKGGARLVIMDVGLGDRRI